MSVYRAPRLDLTKTRCFDVAGRHNLVRIDNLLRPAEILAPDYVPTPAAAALGRDRALRELARAIHVARSASRPVLLFFGAHVIKRGLSPLVIALLEEGHVTAVASNGAGSIHDFELACLGGTSEHVPSAIEDGSFGMWEQTGRGMWDALRAGSARGLGYGESLAAWVEAHPQNFPHVSDCVFAAASRLGCPATYHVTVGTDIIHQHPTADFALLGETSGRDFAIFCHVVSELSGGVFINAGSAVTGPEVFLKALSIARNQGHGVHPITTANLDLRPLARPTEERLSDSEPDYYYRPLKNILQRPTSLGGRGLRITGDHRDSFVALYRLLHTKEAD
ncbi:MAG: hypothetical protein QM270_04410 [Bacillota bacterium]|nr:hypothetical protein [Bacillota bacterium]